MPGTRSGATPTAATRNALGPPTSESPAGARRAARSSGAPPTGPKPDATYLSPAQAGDELQKLLAEAPRQPTDPRRKRDQDRTFAEACDAWLDYVEHEKALRPSTVRDYRNAVGCYLLPEFGATTLLRTIDTARIDAYRERLLTEGELSRRTIQKILVQLYSILKRASARAGSTPTLPRTPSASP